MSHVVVAEVVRSGFVEGRHHGSVVSLAADGSVAWSVGDAGEPILPRSCNKPVQALAMLRAGLELPPDLLAMACASHSGEEMHVERVHTILRGAGLDAGHLQCPADWPLDPAVKEALLRRRGDRSRAHMNCSGKHAAMLATCVVNGWSTHDYLDPAHPLQRLTVEVFAEMTGEEVDTIATDGCGAPLLSTSLTGLATAFRRLALGLDGRDEADVRSMRIAEAIRTHPELVSGSTRDERALLAAVPGAIGKGGAEACHVVALPDGRAVALKIEDGGERARPVVMVEALWRSGVLEVPGVDVVAVEGVGRHVLLGGGQPVGEVRSAF
ncbi:asparaginase [Nocardioides perillae]|uniref:L-asparaginase II n=1 Tax=Nocardioides perillae TaxID=1119534 RepID=A0A7Y9RVI6_9ACTN|nr:asparaginase [Nocardioides perillae]NYG54710.1 L-asparaginase II [Nocardioides perillae]